MKKFILSLSAIAMIAGFSGNLMAADPTNTTSVTINNVDAKAVIVAPITLTKTTGSELNFGTIAAGTTIGTCVINGTATLTTTGGITLPSVSVQTTRVPEFTVHGETNSTYSITLPANGTKTITGPDGSMPMAVNDFKAYKTSSDITTGTLTGGQDVFTVGATLSVGINQAAGSYAGTFAVTVDYN